MRKDVVLVIELMVCMTAASYIGLAAPDNNSWTVTRLTNNSVYDVDVCISGDGNKIVFVEDRDGNPYTGWDWDVMLIDLNTMDMSRITETEPDAFGLPDLWPSINYDGSKFIYDEYIIFGFCVISSNIDGTNEVGIADYAKYPYLTSDGTKVIYTIENEDEETGETTYQLHIANIDGSNDRILFTGSDRDYIAKANSDGSKIVFCRDGGYLRDELYIIDSDGTNLRKISDVPNFPTFGISDDGTKVVYTKLMDDDTYRAAMYDITTGTETILGPAGSSAPFISGDGSQIVYLYTQNDKIYLKIVGGPDIYIGDNDYSANYYGRLYTPTRYVSISRDGTKIAFVSCADGNPEVYIATKESIHIPSGSILNNFFVPQIVFPYTTIIFESEKSPLSTVTIPVTIKKAEDVGSMNLDLTYNSEILTAVDVIPGDLTQNSIVEKNIGEGKIRIGLIDTNGINGNGTLFYVKFNVTATNKTSSKTEYTGELGRRIDISGTGGLPWLISRENYSPLNIENAVVSDLEGNKITVTTINGTFTVGSRKGDVNGDGAITSVDALMALKMSVGELEVDMVADMDEDGQVLANDALQIMNLALDYNVQHFAGLLSGGFNFNGFGGG